MSKLLTAIKELDKKNVTKLLEKKTILAKQPLEQDSSGRWVGPFPLFVILGKLLFISLKSPVVKSLRTDLETGKIEKSIEKQVKETIKQFDKELKTALEIMELLLKNGANPDACYSHLDKEYKYDIKETTNEKNECLCMYIFGITPMVFAAQYSEEIRFQVMDKLIFYKADINKKVYAKILRDREKIEMSPLSLAAIRGDVSLINYLCDKKVAIDQRLGMRLFCSETKPFDYYTTAAGHVILSSLYISIFKSSSMQVRKEVLELLIKKGCDISTNYQGVSLLTLSILTHNEEIFAFLLEEIGKLEKSIKEKSLTQGGAMPSEFSGLSPFWLAIEHGTFKMVNALLNEGCDLFFMEPIHQFREEKNSGPFVVQRYFDTQISALQLSSKRKSIEMFSFVLSLILGKEHKNKLPILTNTLIEAIAHNNLELVKVLVEAVSPQYPDFVNRCLVEGHIKGKETYFGYAPLAVAASLQRVDIVKYLLSKKADINIINPDGHDKNLTPISYLFTDENTYQANMMSTVFCKDESLKVIEILLENGANIWQEHPEYQVPYAQMLLFYNRKGSQNFIELFKNKKSLDKIIPDEKSFNLLLSTLISSENMEIMTALIRARKQFPYQGMDFILKRGKKDMFVKLLPICDGQDKRIISLTKKHYEKTLEKFYLLAALDAYYPDLTSETVVKFGNYLQKNISFSDAVLKTNNKILSNIFPLKKKITLFKEDTGETIDSNKLIITKTVPVSMPVSNYLHYAGIQRKTLALYLKNHVKDDFFTHGVHYHLLRFMQAIVEHSLGKNKCIQRVRNRLMHGYENLDKSAYLDLINVLEKILAQSEKIFDEELTNTLETWLKKHPMPKDQDYSDIMSRHQEGLYLALDKMPFADNEKFDFYVSVIRSLLIYIGECQQQSRFEIPGAEMFLEAIKELRDTAGHIFIKDETTGMIQDELPTTDVLGIAFLAKDISEKLLFKQRDESSIKLK